MLWKTKMEDTKFKIRVHNKKESAEIQRVLFKLGYAWASTEKNVKHTDKVGLFFEIDNFYITYTPDLNYFKKHRNKEVTFAKLKSKAFQTFLKKMMILKKLE